MSSYKFIVIFIHICVWSIIIDYSKQLDLKDGSNLVAGESTRQCECYKWPDCISNCTANPILSKLFASKHKTIEKIPLPFIVIFPYQVRKQKRKKIHTNTLNKQGHYKLETNFWIHLLNGEDLQLQLKKSSIFGDESKRPNNFQLKYYEKSRVVVSNTLKKCFYTGSVIIENPSSSAHKSLSDNINNLSRNKVIAHSHVAADTCDGLRGIILYKGRVYGIKPMKFKSGTNTGDNSNSNNNEKQPVAHFIYPETTSLIDRKANNLRTFWHKRPPLSLSPKDNTKLMLIPIAVYVDSRLMKQFDKSSIDEASYFVLSLINSLTTAFTSLQKLLQIRLHSMELWNMGDRSSVNSKSIKETMNSFMKYILQQEASDNVKPRVSLLLSNSQFLEDVEYFSIPDSICTKRAIAVIQITSIKHVYHSSRLMALAIAEMFGINRFPCPNKCQVKTVLSKEDQNRIKLVLRNRQADCLIAKNIEIPDTSVSKYKIKNPCGNGQLDLSEECDPSVGFKQKPMLTCCDKTTCLMAPYAQCNSGECCSNNCTYLTRGRYCRPAKDNCDVPEFCSGDSGECPNDIYLENTQPCDRGSALCYEGRCPTRNKQCAKLWGSTKAKHANNHCYSTWKSKRPLSSNPNTADCKDGKCSKENLLCGTLYCAGGPNNLRQSQYETLRGPNKPVLVNTYIEFNNKSVQCKYIQESKLGNVEDGTQCGPNKYCFGQICAYLTGSTINATKCPRNTTNNKTFESICFGKGICTYDGYCLCHPGWGGADCTKLLSVNKSLPLRIGFIDKSNKLNYSEQVKNYIWAYFKEVGIYTGPKSFEINNGNGNLGNNGLWSKVKKTHFIAAVGCLVLLFCIILIVLMLCYRRRIVHRSKHGFSTYNNPNNNENGENADGNGGNYRYNRHTNSPSKSIMGRKSNQYGLSEVTRKTDELRYDNRKKRRRRTDNQDGNTDNQDKAAHDYNHSATTPIHQPNSPFHNNENMLTPASSGSVGPHHHMVTQQLLIPTSGTPDDLLMMPPASSAVSANQNIDPSIMIGSSQSHIHSSSAGNSMDRMIKFGIMPSYKEDKLRSGAASHTTSSGSNTSSLQHNKTNTNETLLSNNTAMAPSLFPLVNPSTTNQTSPYHRYTTTTQSTPSTQLPIGLPAPALFPNVPLTNHHQQFYNQPNLVNNNANIVTTGSGVPVALTNTTSPAHNTSTITLPKQPEKGILKNKTQNGTNNNKNCLKCETKQQDERKKAKKDHHLHTCHKKNKAPKTPVANSSPTTTQESSLSSSHDDDDDSSSNSSATSSSTCSSSSSTSSSSSVGIASLITHAAGTNKSNSMPPTVLCNAANQTEDRVTSDSNREYLIGGCTNHHSNSNIIEEDEDCDEDDCEECIRLRGETVAAASNTVICNTSNTSHPHHQHPTLTDKSNSTIATGGRSTKHQQRQKSPPETLITSNSSAYDIVGSTTDENNYHQELVNYGGNNTSGNSINNANQMMLMMMPPASGMMMMMNSNHQPSSSISNNHNNNSSTIDESVSGGQNSEPEVDSHLQQYNNQNSNNNNQYLIHQPYPSSHQLLVSGNSQYSTVSSNPNSAGVILSNSLGGGGSSNYYYPPITNHGTDLSQHLQDQHSGSTSNNPRTNSQDDSCSDVSISAYCRVNTNHTNALKRQPITDDSTNIQSTGGTTGTSIDGTIDENGSDTSSLPDTHCDLVNLAHLGGGAVSSRPNPLLSQMMLAAATGHKNPAGGIPNNSTNPQSTILPDNSNTAAWIQSPSHHRTHNHANQTNPRQSSPGQLPNPNIITSVNNNNTGIHNNQSHHQHHSSTDFYA